MDSPVPQKKRRLLPPTSTFDSACVICTTPHQNVDIGFAGHRGRKRLFEVSNKRNDTPLQYRLAQKENISPETPIPYHRSCYQSYTSTSNHCLAQNCPSGKPTEKDNTDQVKTRATSSKINWDSCMFCQQRSWKGNKQLHEIKTEDGENEVKKAILQRNDSQLLGRLYHENFLQRRAKYHGNCRSSYVSDRNIQVALTKNQNHSPYETAFDDLMEEIKGDLVDGKVFTLTGLLSQFREKLGNNEAYTSNKLKQSLQMEESIRIFARQGSPSFVCHSQIDMAKVLQLKQVPDTDMPFEEAAEDQPVDVKINTHATKLSIVHQAVGFIRKEIEALKESNTYPTKEDLKVEQSELFVPPLLKAAVKWIVDKDSFRNGQENFVSRPEKQIKYLALSEALIHSARNIITPCQLGLAVQFHNENGKRDIIDTLHAHGFSSSYDTVRQFLTSTAQEECRLSENSTYIPSELTSRLLGGALIQEGDDNIDINCETINGYGTFHSMAKVVFQDGNISTTSRPIKISQHRSLEISDSLKCNIGILDYHKPTVRPLPPPRTNPMIVLNSFIIENTTIPVKELAWVLLRCLSHSMWCKDTDDDDQPPRKQLIPLWAGYNSKRSLEVKVETKTAYAPILQAKPSDFRTVYTTMVKHKNMVQQLGQPHGVQTMDQQLYAVAQQVKWAKKEEFANHVLRLGGFHTLSAFIGCIGKLWGEAGLHALLVDSGTYAEATTQQMLLGKQFNRAVRALTLTFEVLLGSLLDTYFQKKSVDDKLMHQLKQVHKEIGLGKLGTIVDYLELQLKASFEHGFTKFVVSGSKNPTFKFWYMLIEALSILLSNIRAEREGDWKLHLATTREMLPYFFICNKQNYSRWLPAYLLDMHDLPDMVKQSFMEGQFAIRQKTGVFNGIWSDMGTEKTIIKDAKGKSGIIGMTSKEPALLRWTLTRHILGGYSKAMRKRSGIHQEKSDAHSQTMPAAMQRDDEDVQTMKIHIVDNMTNPFEIDKLPDGLVNIASGVHATPEIQKSMTSSIDLGKALADKFVSTRLSLHPATGFYHPITRSQLKTFEEMRKPTKLHIGDKTKAVSISSELLFRRALVITQKRQLTLDSLLQRPVTSVPASLFEESGQMRKTTKSDLMHRLEEETIIPKQLPNLSTETTAFIRDGMALFQSMDVSKLSKFQDVAEAYLQRLLLCFQHADTVMDVFDRYDIPLSTKNAERIRRQNSGVRAGLKVSVIGGRDIPKWGSFLALGENKASLAEYICQYIESAASTRLQPHQKIYLSGGLEDGTKTTLLQYNSITHVQDLICDHEEGDTRMIFLALKKANEDGTGLADIIVQCDDTDVLVLLLHFHSKMASTKVWFKVGHTSPVTGVSNLRYIPVHTLAAALGNTLCQILPALHAVTGCDTTSSLFNIGKRTMLKTVLDKGPGVYASLASLGGTIDEDTFQAVEDLVFDLYIPKRANVSGGLVGLRCYLTSTQDSPLAKLPPSQSALRQHILRAHLQTNTWLRSDEPYNRELSPLEHRWWKENETLAPVYFNGSSAAELINGLICNCSGKGATCGEQTPCPCRESGLSCTDLCKCFIHYKCTNDVLVEVGSSN